MKTTKTTLIAMMFTLAAVISGNSAEAQRRNKDNDRSSRVKRYKEMHKKDIRDEGRDRDYKYKIHPGHDKKHHHTDRNYNKHHSNHGHYDYYSNRNYHHHEKHRHHDYYSHKKHQYYRHPHYGMVYRKFYKSPVRFRHHNCDYYYMDGYYYRHHHGVGYVRVELPGNVIIEHLPDRCEHFTYHGHRYYKSGDLVFERYRHGFRIIPNFNLQFIARF